MSKIFTRVTSVACSLILLGISVVDAQSKLVSFWDFNQTIPASGGGGDSLGTVTSYINGVTATTSTLFANYTTNAPSGNLATSARIVFKGHPTSSNQSIMDNNNGGSFIYDYSSNHTYFGNSGKYYNSSDSSGSGGNIFVRSRNPVQNDTGYIYLPTTGYQNIILSFAMQQSSTTSGPRENIFQYSTNGYAGPWNKLTSAMDTFKLAGVHKADTLYCGYMSTTWYPVKINFSSDPSVNNISGFVVRWEYAGGTITGTSGNDRYDNFALTADSICPSFTMQPTSAAVCGGGASNASFSVGTEGGTSVSYQWYVNTGSGYNIITNGTPYSNATTSTLNITGATGGMTGYLYECQVSNTNCGTITSNAATLTVDPILTVTVPTFSNVTCTGNGSATASISGGTSPYTYSWSNSQTNAAATNLIAGTYTITVKDKIGCSGSTTVVIAQNGLAVNITSSSNIECTAFGSATALASNGTSPYTYSWTDGETNATASALGAGTFTVTAKDNTGCTGSTSVIILQFPQMRDSISGQYKVIHYWDFNNTPPSGGAGGDSLGTSSFPLIAPYSLIPGLNPRIVYSHPNTIQTGATILDGILDNGAPSAANQAAWANDLPLLGNDTATIGVNNLYVRSRNPDINAYMYLYLPTTGFNNVKLDYAISVSSTSGANYNLLSYSTNGGSTWKNLTTVMDTFNRHSSNGPDSLYMITTTVGPGGAESAGKAWTPIHIDFSSDPSVNNNPNFEVRWTFLGPNNTGTSGNDRYDNISLSGNQLSLTCNGNNNYTATAGVKYGVMPYTYSWSPSGGSTNVASNLNAGTYTLTIKDASGCTTTSAVTISQPALLTTSISSLTNVSCNGYYTGAATVSASGGTSPYNYSWSSGGGTLNNINGVSSGTYSVTVTDAVGCTATTSVTLSQPVTLVAMANTTANANCSVPGSASSSASGGTSPYTYSWSNNQTTANATGLSASTYTITITDSNGCSATASATITQPATLGISLSSVTNASCNGGNGSITVNAPSGGISPYTYSWSGGGGTNQTATVSAGTYTLTAYDNTGCTATISATISQPATAVAITISSTTPAGCTTNGSATANAASGGVAPYTYSWSSGGGTNLTISATAGTYTITAKDNSGCSSSASAIIAPAIQLRDSVSLAGQYEVIHYWDFNNTLPAGGAGGDSLGTSSFPLPAPYSVIPGTSPRIIYSHPNTIQTGATILDGILDNGAPAANQEAWANDLHLLGNDTAGSPTNNLYVRSRNPDENAYMYLYLPTNGFGNVKLDYAISVSSTSGANYNLLSYSTNGGSSWNNLTTAMDTFNRHSSNGPDSLYMITTTVGPGGAESAGKAWTPIHIDFSSDPSVNNNPNFEVRWTFLGPNNTGTSGNDRYDNISLSGNTITETCNGGNQVNATAEVKYGTAPYTYSWAPTGGSSVTASNLVAGTYTLTVKDANGCSGSSTVTVSNPPLLTATVPSTTSPTCAGGNNASATASATGGTSPYKYSWSAPGGTLATLSGLSAGTFTVTITDAFGCTSTASTTITQPPAIVVSIPTYTNATCSSNGSATAGVTNGTSPYTYSWTDPSHQTTVTATNLTAGTYTVSVKDNHGCSGSASVTITQPASSVSVSITSHTNIECLANGTATASASGGTIPYTYSWNNGETVSTATGLGAGSYTVTVHDNSGCNSSANVTILQVPQIRDSVSSVAGQLEVIHYWDFNNTLPSSGGGGDSLGTSTFPLVAPYSLIPGSNPKIVYSRPSAIQTGSGATRKDSILDNYSPSTPPTPPYCYINDLHILGNDSAASAAGNLTIRSRNPDVNSYMYLYLPTTGYSNVVLNYAISASSSKAALYNIFSYSTNGGSSWKNLNTAMDTFNISGVYRPDTLQFINPTTVGSAWYPVQINFSSDPSINNNPNFIVRWEFEGGGANGTSGNARYDNISLSGSLSTETCYGGNQITANAGVKYGTAPYTYSWAPSGGSSTSASSLTAGIYTLTVTDAIGCSASSTVTVSNPPLLTATVSAQTNITCSGGTNGSATATVTGGTSPYKYSWLPAGGTLATASGLSAGTFTITVSDAFGCTATNTATITQPLAIIAAISSYTNATCSAPGSATAGITNGTSPYIYSWTDPTHQTSVTATGLTAGTYSVTVTDNHGCSGSASVTISQPPASVSVSIASHTNVECTATGTAVALASGGTLPYTYSWSDGETTATASLLSAGTYTITVRDNVGCNSFNTVAILQVAPIRDSLSALGQYKVIHYWDFNNTQPSTGTGGDSLGTSTNPLLAPYTLIPGGNPRITCNRPLATQPGASGRDSIIDNLSPGAPVNDLPLLGDDSSGTAAGNLGIRSRNPDENQFMTLYLPTTGYSDITLNYAISVSSTKGANYNIFSYSTNGGTSWKNLTTAMDTFNRHSSNGPDSLFMITGTPGESAGNAWTPIHVDFSSDPSVNNNPNFIVRWQFEGAGSSGTSGNDRYDNISLSGYLPTETCFGGDNVTATAGIKYGTAPYTYSWTPNVSSSGMASNLSAGTYSLTVKDANGCSASSSVTVSQPVLLSAVITSLTTITCNSFYSGGATASASGGTSPYIYSWSPSGGTTNSIIGVSAGTYTITVNDILGCSASAAVTLTQPLPLGANASVVSNVLCNGNNTGSASVVASGDASPYTYQWSDAGSQSTATATGLSAGSYTVTVQDSCGAFSVTASVTITQPASALAISIASVSNVLCFSGTGTATANAANGGTSPYTYSWSDGAGSNLVATATAGTYTITVTDSNGCTATAAATITQPASAVTITIASVSNATCTADGSATANAASGGTSPYTYSWSSSGGSNLTASLTSGTYTITATDNYGCMATASATITQSVQLRDSVSLAGQLEVIHYWDFNNTLPSSGGGGDSLGTSTFPLVAPYSLIPGSNPRIVYSRPSAIQTGSGATRRDSILDNYSPSTPPTPPYCYINDLHILGNDSAGSAAGNLTIRSRNPDVNSYMYLYLPTTGYSNVVLNYAISGSSSKAALYNIFSYSTNGGTSWNKLTRAMDTFNISGVYRPDTLQFINPTTVGSSWYPVQINFSSDPSINNNPNFIVRWEFEGGGANGTSGNARYDNISLSGNLSTETCYGGNQVSATAEVKYGTAPYTYSWAPSGGSSSTSSNLTAGTYTLTIKDVNGCSVSSTVTVSNPPLLTATVSSQTNITCSGGTNGSATATVTGGTSPYKYSWLPAGGTLATASGLSAGTYTITVSDAFGCTATNSVTITQPLALVTTITSYTNATCSSTGSAMAGVTNGTSPYTYSWTDPTHQTSVTATGLTAGTYTITVTDNHGCTGSASLTISQPPASVSVSIASHTNVECTATGTAVAIASGGTLPYTYSWSDGETTATASLLSAGTYTITVRDNVGCNSFNTVTILQVAPIRDSLSALGQYKVIHYWDFNNTQPSTGTGGDSLGTSTNPLLAPYTLIPGGNPRITCNRPLATQPGASGRDSIIDNLSPGAPVNDLPLLGDDSSGTAAGNLGIRSRNPDENQFMTLYLPTTGYSDITLNYAISVSSTKGANYNIFSYSTNGGTSWKNLTTAMDTFNRHSSNGPDSLFMITGTPGESAGNAWTPIHVDFSSDPSVNNNPNFIVRWQFEGAGSSGTSGNDRYDNISLSGYLPTETCFGGDNVTATAGIKYGTAPYTYSWTPNVSSSGMASNLSAGTYSLTVKDANGCSASSSVTVSQPVLLSAVITSVSNITCNSFYSGGATASASGGTSPYNYSWSPSGGTTNSIIGVSAGTYTITVNDILGCSASAAITLTQPLPLGANASVIHNVNCNGNSTGSASVVASGDASPYTYQWSDAGSQSTATATGLSAGSYTVTVQDSCGAFSATASVTITQPASALAISIASVSNVLCFSGTGTATANAAGGGTSPYTYSWSGGAGSNLVATATAGTYTITVTDSNGCTATAAATITQPASALGITVASVSNVYCNGGTGSVTANTASGGSSPYTYSWSNGGGTSLSISSVTAGTYTITVTDNNGCTASASATITQSASTLNISISSVNNVSCNGGNGTITANAATGGSSPYTYSWSPGGGTSLTTIPVGAGSYTLTVTDSHGCSATTSATITQPASALVIGTLDVTNVYCTGGTGNITVDTVMGGISPYTYTWTGGAGTNESVTVIAGTYTVTVSDSNGCTASASATVTQPATTVGISISSVNNVSCSGGTGSITANAATGGTSPYTYTWHPNGGNSLTTTAISAGTYTIIVIDNNGCTATATASVTQAASALGITIASASNALCNGVSGNVTANAATGGSSPYTYSWSPTGGTGLTASVSAGTYTITVTDNHGCTASASATITQSAYTLGISVPSLSNINCRGELGSVTASAATGGTSPYTYSWSGGEGSNLTINVTAGTYTITVKDANGCIASASTTVTQVPYLGISIASVNNIMCYGSTGSITANTATGGISPYTYTWNPYGGTGLTSTAISAGTYTVIVIDNNGCSATAVATVTQPATAVGISIASVSNASCNGANGSLTANAATGGLSPYTYSWSGGGGTNLGATLSAGTYTITATDNNGCTATASATITQPVNTIAISIASVTNVSCSPGTGSATASAASGGSSPYTYSWSDGNSQTTPPATGLSAGTYTLTVTDNNGCSASTSATITQPANSLGITLLSVSNVSCNGGNGSITASAATGGTAPYTYSWSPNGGTGLTATVSAGTYTLTVTDNNGCNSIATATLSQPATAVSISLASVSNVLCKGGTGSATANAASGGVSPYTYRWSDAGSQATLTATGLSAGSYTITVTDSNGCTATTTATITQPANVLGITIASVSNVSIFGASTGSATANSATGGTSPYTYSWSDGNSQATLTATGLSAGTYTITVTDNNGCSATASTTITQPSNALGITIASESNASCNGANGSITANVATGGTAPYTYSWSPTGGTGLTGTVSAGTYTITVTDNLGSTATASATVTAPATAVTIGIASVSNVSCTGGTGSATANAATGGSTPYTYNWSDGSSQATLTATGLSAGTYTITVNDGNGCSATAAATITEPEHIVGIHVSSVTNVSCFGGTGSAIAHPSNGGTPPYTYSWSPNGGADTIASGLSAGTYTITMTDNHGCSATASATVTQPLALHVTTVVSSNVTCNGLSNGSGSVSASGGTAPYTYSWSDGVTTTNNSGLSAGTYTVSVTDNNGCSASHTMTILQPAALVLSTVIQTNVSCNSGTNGIAKVGVSGGTLPYTYSWSSGSTTYVANNLSAGTYTVTVTDKNGCNNSGTATITQPVALGSSVTITYPNCVVTTGSASVAVTGGTPPYVYTWSPPVSTTSSATTLALRTYVVSVKDAHGCTTALTFVISQPPVIRDSVVRSSVVEVSCGLTNNGSATVGAKYGTQPYTYSWTNGSTSATASGLSVGTYSVTVTDINSCHATTSVTITQTPGLTITTTIQNNVGCNGGTNGIAKAGVSGGVPSYTYSWSPGGSTTYIANNLSAGTYTVSVTDKNGCNNSATATVTQPAVIRDSLAYIDNATCHGGTGSAGVGVTGGTPPYLYTWSPPVSTTATATGLTARTYVVSIKDADGCTAFLTFTITQPLAVHDSIVRSATVNVLCNGSATGSATVGAKNGTQPYTYSWSNASITATASGLSAGTYTVSVMDACGNMAVATVSITQPNAIRDSISSSSCTGGLVTATVGVRGGVAPYTYSWAPGGGTRATMSGLSVGTYTITVTDRNQCSVVITPSLNCNDASPVHPDVTESTCCPGVLYNVDLYPNPNSGQFTIAGVEKGMLIEVYDYTGRKVSVINAGDVTVHLDIANEPNGVYLVRILDKDGTLVSEKKVVKVQ